MVMLTSAQNLTMASTNSRTSVWGRGGEREGQEREGGERQERRESGRGKRGRGGARQGSDGRE